VDAFRDIFAEFREKFQKEGSALREAERKQLEENLKAADRAFAQAVGPEASAAAKKTLDEAKKALEDFYAAAPAPDLADLRAQLNSVFRETEVNKFFQALGESGLSTFEDFEKAGTDSIVGILQKLQEIGFNFGDTSQAIIDANKELVEAEKVANAGLDPLQEAINLIKGLNEGAAQLPPVFNSTTTAIEGLNGPLASLSAGFDNILEKLSPCIRDDGKIPSMIDPFGGSGGFTTGYINFINKEYPDVDWSSEVNKISHFEKLKKYDRVDIELNEQIVLDDYTSFDKMDAIFNMWINIYHTDLDKICSEL
jgi:hypothetical protein